MLAGQPSRQRRVEMSKQLYMLIYRHLRIEGRMVGANLRDCTIKASVTVAAKIDDVKQELSTRKFFMRVTTPSGEMCDKYVLNVRMEGCVTEKEIFR